MDEEPLHALFSHIDYCSIWGLPIDPRYEFYYFCFFNLNSKIRHGWNARLGHSVDYVLSVKQNEENLRWFIGQLICFKCFIVCRKNFQNIVPTDI